MTEKANITRSIKVQEFTRETLDKVQVRILERADGTSEIRLFVYHIDGSFLYMSGDSVYIDDNVRQKTMTIEKYMAELN